MILGNNEYIVFVGGEVLRNRLRFDRYWPVGLVFVVLLAWGVYSSSSPRNIDSTLAPAPAIMAAADANERGVELRWLSARTGVSPIVGYRIERSRSGGAFEYVGRAQGAQMQTFLDAEGRDGDVYRLITEDTQANHSPASNQVTAVPPKPGSKIVVVPSSSLNGVLGTAVDLQATPDEQAAQWQTLAARDLQQLDDSIEHNFPAPAVQVLSAVQEYYRQLLLLFPRLSTAQQLAIVQHCAQHMPQLERNLSALSEASQGTALHVLGACRALEEVAQ